MILYYTILYCTVLYHTILYYSILFYSILSPSKAVSHFQPNLTAPPVAEPGKRVPPYALHIYIYIYIYIYTCMYMYIYIYIERERERCMCIYIYIYMSWSWSISRPSRAALRTPVCRYTSLADPNVRPLTPAHPCAPPSQETLRAWFCPLAPAVHCSLPFCILRLLIVALCSRPGTDLRASGAVNE